MKQLMLSILAAGTLLIAGCTKTGPQGPQGPTGNANVIGENPFTVSSWTAVGAVSSNTATSYYATFTDANITSDVAAYGLVEIYKLYTINGSGWTNLPDIDGVTTTVYNFGTGGFTISVLTTDGSLTTYPDSVEFRAVIIPSSVRQANPHTNWKNYAETMAVLNKARAQGMIK